MHFQNFFVYCALCTFTLSVAVQVSTNCESDSDCNQERLFVCNSEQHKCDCKREISIYDSKKGECVLISGATCDSSRDNRCVSHAKCENRQCKCKPDYFTNMKGECERKKTFNGTCTRDKECQVDGKGSPLICGNGRCGCASDRPIFIALVCALPAGSDCSYDSSLCVANSNCQTNPDESEVCTCNSEFFQTSLGTCERKRSHGEACYSNVECMETGKLICDSDGICECDKPLHIYDPLQNTCAFPLGSECKLAATRMSSKCVTYSQCRPSQPGIKSGYSGTCQCEFGKERNGTCVISHGGKCGMENRKCNEEEQGTICIEGICSCKIGVFDEQKEKCVSNVFGFCDDSVVECISNSHCAPQQGHTIMRNCVCDEGFVPVNYACKATIGQRCNYTEIDKYSHRSSSIGNCDPISSLRCINGSCQCVGEEEYDFGVRKCRGLVSSFCEFNDKSYCIENAECIPRWTYLTYKGRCECKSGWETSKDRKCVEAMTTSTPGNSAAGATI